MWTLQIIWDSPHLLDTYCVLERGTRSFTLVYHMDNNTSVKELRFHSPDFGNNFDPMKVFGWQVNKTSPECI